MLINMKYKCVSCKNDDTVLDPAVVKEVPAMTSIFVATSVQTIPSLNNKRL